MVLSWFGEVRASRGFCGRRWQHARASVMLARNAAGNIPQVTNPRPVLLH